MPKTDQKTEDIKKYISNFAKFLISNIGDIQFTIDVFRNPELSQSQEVNIKELLPAKEWLQFYFKRRQLNNKLILQFNEWGYFSPKSFHLSPFKDLTLLFSSIVPSDNPNSKSNDGREYIEEAFNVSLADLELKTHESDPRDNTHSEEINLIDYPELFFFLKVEAPCIFLLGEDPSSLLQRARLGDLDALDKMLRIDKTILCDPLIGEQIYLYSLLEDKTEFETIINALQGNLSGKYDMLKTKYRIAGFISVVTDRIGYRLSAPEIRELFDEIAVERGNGDLIDTDLPDSPEAFSKAIQRERLFWNQFL